ncbi:MAG: hypothetical protein ACOX6X_07710 [Dethiobacteria bacterium]|jgi:ABC-type antimicrobial peptide transport system permease subunit
MHDLVIKIIESGPPFWEALKRLKKHKLAIIGAVVVLLLCFTALFAPFLAPHDPVKQVLSRRLLPPGCPQLTISTWRMPL